MVWLGLARKMTCSGGGKDCGLGWVIFFFFLEEVGAQCFKVGLYYLAIYWYQKGGLEKVFTLRTRNNTVKTDRRYASTAFSH